MKVVDAQDDRPLSGALALFQATAHEGTSTGHGGKQASLFAVEAITNESGELQFPVLEFSAQPFFLNTNYHNPSMVVLKPGYVVVVLVNSRRIVPELRDVTTWEHDNATIRMKAATTDNDVYQTADRAAAYAGQAMSERSPCSWKSIPRFLSAVDRAVAEWNQKRAFVFDEALRRRSVRSPLQLILQNDGYFVAKGCGSPRAFFEAYLR